MQSFDLNRCPQCCSPSWLLNQINSSGVIASWHIVGDLVWDDRSQKTAYFEINYYVVSLETHRIGYVLSLNGRIFLLGLNVPSVAYNLSYYFITYKLDRYNIIRLYILYVIPRLAIFQLTIFHLVVGRPVATSGTTESCSSCLLDGAFFYSILFLLRNWFTPPVVTHSFYMHFLPSKQNDKLHLRI